MKTIKLMIAGLLFVLSGTLQAQVSVSINIGTPPQWGPAESSSARFYYLPDIEVYYDINTSNYIYFSDGRWVSAAYLPSSYGDYDLYGAYKVTLVDYHGERPYESFDAHKKSYPKGYNHGHSQKTRGERPHKDNSDDKGHKHGNNGHGYGNNGHDKREDDK
jgi:hypothetical protein